MSISAQQEAEIARLFHVDRWRVGNIATHFQIHHSVVRRVLGDEVKEAGEAKKSRKVERFVDFIKSTLEKYPTISSARVHAMVKQQGYEGSKSGFRRIVAGLRPVPFKEAYVRRTVLPGQEAQVDWGDFGLWKMERSHRRLYAFVMTLSYSRCRYIRFFVSCAMPAFLRGHEAAFRHFGGVPRTILYDNLKSVVIERAGSVISFNETFSDFAKHYLFEPRPCAPARGNEKGRVERTIRDIREGFFIAREWSSLSNLNEQVLLWCEQIAQERKVPEDRKLLQKDAFLQEKAIFVPLPNPPFECTERVEVHAQKTPYIRFDCNDYSIPHTHVRRTLTVLATDEQVRIVDGSTLLAEHPRCLDKYHTIEDAKHLDGLVERKRKGQRSSAANSLFDAVPVTKIWLERVAREGFNLGSATSGLLRLVTTLGAKVVHETIEKALSQEEFSWHVVQRMAHEEASLRNVSQVFTPTHTKERFQALSVKPHALSNYDRLTQGDGR